VTTFAKGVAYAVALLLAREASAQHEDVPRTASEATPSSGSDAISPPGLWDAVATAALAGGLAAVNFGVPTPSEPSWTATNGFDDWVRGGLRISSPGGRSAAATTSDVLTVSLLALPFLEAFLASGHEPGSSDLAWRKAAIDAETLLTVGIATLSIQRITARQRPYVLGCAPDSSAAECSGGGRFTSFPSGHTAVAFAVVALECFHQDDLGPGWAPACPLAVTAATVTGVLRIAADRHWATDVLAGAALGLAIGYTVPALHLALGAREAPLVIAPAISPGYLGAALAGRF
jgi:membrane-associated phospholipid phosphatase